MHEFARKEKLDTGFWFGTQCMYIKANICFYHSANRLETHIADICTTEKTVISTLPLKKVCGKNYMFAHM